MQTLEFTDSLKRIVIDLKVSELAAVFEPWISTTSQQAIDEGTKQQASKTLLAAYANMTQLLKLEPTRKILTGLKIVDTFDPTKLAKLLSTIDGLSSPHLIRSNQLMFVQIFTFFEQLRTLLVLENTCVSLLEVEKLGATPATELLTLQVADFDGRGIEVERMERITELLLEIYAALTVLYNVSGEKLRFRYFDSGSDVRLGLVVGAAASIVLKSLNKIMGEWWDRIKFGEQIQFDRTMDSYSKGISVVKELSEAVANNAMTQEDADNLKARILGGANNLMKEGVTLPLDSEARIDQRQLLSALRDTKLLGEGVKNTGTDTDKAGTPPSHPPA